MAAADAVRQQEPVIQEIGTAVRHSLVYGLGGVLTKALGFLMLPLYTHFLTPKDYGILELLDLSMSLLGMVLNMGLTAAILRFYGAAQSEAERRRIISTSFFFALGTGLGVFALGSLLVSRVTVVLLGPGVSPVYLFLSFAYFIMGYIGTVPYTYVRAREQSGRLVTLDTFSTVLILIANVFFLVVLKLSILGVLLGPIVSAAVKMVVLFAWMAPSLRLVIDWKRLRQMLGFGTPLVLSSLTMFTLNFSDRFFLQHFQSLEIVGIYSVGYKVGYMLNFLLIQQFNMMWQARMYIIQRIADHRLVFRQIFVLYSMVLIFAGLGLSLFGRELMNIMVDRRYAGGQQVIPVVALAYVFLGVGYYLQLGMYLAGRTNLIGIVSIAAAGLNLGLNYVLIRGAGMMGAAWATLFAFLALAVGSGYFSERVYPLGLGVGRVIRGLGLAIAVYLVSVQLTLHSLVLAVLVKSALLAGFVALTRIAGVFSSDEIATLDAARDQVIGLTARLRRPAWLGGSR